MAYKVSKGAKGCMGCETPFAAEQDVHSALFEDGEVLRREDFCVDCWGGGKEGAFCHWRTRFRPEEKKPTFDQDRVLTVFDQISEGDSPSRDRLRYLLALMLVRKRVFRFMGSGGEEIRVHCPEREKEYVVVDPGLSSEEILAAQDELSGLLDIEA